VVIASRDPSRGSGALDFPLLAAVGALLMLLRRRA